MRPRLCSGQAGFALFNAIFLLVVLAAVGVFMVTLSGVGHYTSLWGLQGARVYHAARSGIEWGSVRALAGNCASTAFFTVEGINITVTCAAAPFTEGTDNFNVYQLTSVAEQGAFGAMDYVSRRLEARVTGP
jgi:MSHA biogenesis protein MshP